MQISLETIRTTKDLPSEIETMDVVTADFCQPTFQIEIGGQMAEVFFKWYQNKNCIDKEYQINYKCYADGICYKFKSLSAARDSKFTHLSASNAIDRPLTWTHTRGWKCWYYRLQRVVLVKFCLYCHHFWPWDSWPQTAQRAPSIPRSRSSGIPA